MNPSLIFMGFWIKGPRDPSPVDNLSFIISKAVKHYEETCTYLCEQKTFQIPCPTSIHSTTVRGGMPVVYLPLGRQTQGRGLHGSWKAAWSHLRRESQYLSYPEHALEEGSQHLNGYMSLDLWTPYDMGGGRLG